MVTVSVITSAILARLGRGGERDECEQVHRRQERTEDVHPNVASSEDVFSFRKAGFCSAKVKRMMLDTELRCDVAYIDS